MEEVDFSEGVKRLVQLGDPLKGRRGVPWDQKVLVGISGWTDAGKSYLITNVSRRLKETGMRVGGDRGPPSMDHFPDVVGLPHIFPDYYFFHCAWGRDLEDENDPNSIVQRSLGRELTMNVGIYNPATTDSFEGPYDLLVRNPATTDSFEGPYDLLVRNPDSLRN